MSLLDPNATSHDDALTAYEPGRTVPRFVEPTVFDGHPDGSMLVALGTVADTTVDDDAASDRCGALANRSAAVPISSAPTCRRACWTR